MAMIPNVLYFLGGKYNEYLGGVKSTYNFSFIILFSLYIFFIIAEKRLCIENQNYKFCLYLLLFALMFKFLAYFSIPISRLSLYFSVSICYLIPYVIENIKINNRMILRTMCLVVCVCVFFLMYVVKKNSNIIPYRTIIGMEEENKK